MTDILNQYSQASLSHIVTYSVKTLCFTFSWMLLHDNIYHHCHLGVPYGKYKE